MIIPIMNSKYKWYILALALLANMFLPGLERFCMPVLFKEISLDLNLNLVQIGTVWGLNSLAGFFVALPGGLLADRFGVKNTFSVICIVTGILSALRGLSINFLTLASTMLLFGLFVTTTPVLVPKVIASWSKPQHCALMNALGSAAWSIGVMIGTMTSATILSPLLGGWRNVIFLFSIPAVVLGILWLTTGRELRKDELPASHVQSVPFRQALSKVTHTKEVWILGLIQIAYVGSNISLLGYLSLYLKNSGWNTTAADSVTTILIGAGLVGVIPMTLLANRLGSIKGMLFFSLLIFAVSIAVLPFVHGSGVYCVVLISGFLCSAIMTFIFTLLTNVNGVGGTYSGTAVGLSSSLAMLGAFVAPPVGNSLEAINPALPFIFWAILAAAGLPLFIFLRKQDKAPALRNQPDYQQ
jgi:MFS family permease